MSRFAATAVGLLLLTTWAACTPRVRQVATTRCPIGREAPQAAPSQYTLCLPTDFGAFDAGAWSRSRRGSRGAETFSIVLLQDSSAIHRYDPWPPVLGNDKRCLADCVTVESLIVHIDTVFGVEARTETGLVSGGFVGYSRAPSLVSGWRNADGSGGVADAVVDNPLTLDTLRMALRTLRWRPHP
jgi:hypothetical protein